MTETIADAATIADLPRAPRRRRWISALLVLAVFVSGTVIGAGSALLFVRQRAQMRIHHLREAVAMDTARLQKALSLTDEQARRVEAILFARQTAILSDVKSEFDRLEEDVAAVLDDHQKTIWHAKLRWLRERWLPRESGKSGHESRSTGTSTLIPADK